MLTAKRVSEIFVECLSIDKEDEKESIKTEGILYSTVFNPQIIRKHKQEIIGLLNELPPQFHEDSGGGWSFLQACFDKNEVQWGEHQQMDQLFQLGQAIGKVSSLVPRDLWDALPGGMPYYVIKKDNL